MAVANPGDSQHGEKPHCPICLDEFKTPRQLPCLHTFCQGCLDDYISSKAVNVTEFKQFECPTCRTVVPVSSKGKTSHLWASIFPINTILQYIGGKEKEKVDRHCYCCFSDGLSVTANGFCVVCEEAMCDSCIKFHKKQKILKEHTIITMEELTDNPKNLISFHKGFRCQKHEEEDLKFYCRDHGITCCASCSIIQHRNCGQVFDLSKSVSNLLQEVKPLQVLEEMKKLEDHLMIFEKRNDSYINSLESQVQEMTNRIKEIRKNLNGLLDDLERKIKSEGNQMYKQEAIRKQGENHECQVLLNAVRNSHVTLETVMKYGSDTQIFIMADRMISHVKLFYEQIKETFEELDIVTLNLEVDSQIECVLAQKSDIGRMICRKERDRFPISRVEKPLKECQIELGDVVKIKGPDDKKPNYTGITYFHGDQVMLADYENKRVILVNSSYQYITSFTLAHSPFDICVVDQHEVAVSFPFQKTLQFMTVTSGSIRFARRVQTRYQCWGIATARKAKVVVSSNYNDSGKHYWSLINSTGKEEICHQFDCQCSPSITYVALNSSYTRVYITVALANSLYCFDIDGTMMYIYSTDSLKGPFGVATDRDDNVYVVGKFSNNIHQLTSDGTPIRIIKEGFPQSSRTICFNNSFNRCLITNDSITDSKNIYVFRFK